MNSVLAAHNETTHASFTSQLLPLIGVFAVILTVGDLSMTHFHLCQACIVAQEILTVDHTDMISCHL